MSVGGDGPLLPALAAARAARAASPAATTARPAATMDFALQFGRPAMATAPAASPNVAPGAMAVPEARAGRAQAASAAPGPGTASAARTSLSTSNSLASLLPPIQRTGAPLPGSAELLRSSSSSPNNPASSIGGAGRSTAAAAAAGSASTAIPRSLLFQRAGSGSAATAVVTPQLDSLVDSPATATAAASTPALSGGSPASTRVLTGRDSRDGRSGNATSSASARVRVERDAHFSGTRRRRPPVLAPPQTPGCLSPGQRLQVRREQALLLHRDPSSPVVRDKLAECGYLPAAHAPAGERALATTGRQQHHHLPTQALVLARRSSSLSSTVVAPNPAASGGALVPATDTPPPPTKRTSTRSLASHTTAASRNTTRRAHSRPQPREPGLTAADEEAERALEQQRTVRARHAAATVIQSWIRRFLAIRLFKQMKRENWARHVTMVALMIKLKTQQMRKRMVIRQQQQLALHREHLARLRPTWAALERGPRVVVHIPSLSLPCSVRSRMDELDLLQFQPGRLCDVHDPDVSVILVSPMPLSTEITEYYEKLLGPQAAGRWTIVVPENWQVFEFHNFSLSDLLLYSPLALQTIRSTIGDKPAVIVPGVVGIEDVEIATFLNATLLGDPVSPSAIRDPLFSRWTEIGLLPGASLGRTADANVLRELATFLVTFHMPGYFDDAHTEHVFVLDKDVGASRYASCRGLLNLLPSWDWVQEKQAHYGHGRWKQAAILGQAIDLIMRELAEALPHRAVVADPEAYPTWAAYVAALQAHGGFVRVAPRSGCSPDSVRGMAHLLISPSRDVTVLGAFEQLHGPAPFAPAVAAVAPCGESMWAEMDARLAALGTALARETDYVGFLEVEFATCAFPFLGCDPPAGAAAPPHDTSSSSVESTEVPLMLVVSEVHPAFSNASAQLSVMRQAGCRFRRELGAFVDAESRPRCAAFAPDLVHFQMGLVDFSVFMRRLERCGLWAVDRPAGSIVLSTTNSARRERFGLVGVADSARAAAERLAAALLTLDSDFGTAGAGDSSSDGDGAPVEVVVTNNLAATARRLQAWLAAQG